MRANQVVAFNDTGAAIKTFAAGEAVSAIGFSVSDNRGRTFSYAGPPLPGNNVSQDGGASWSVPVRVNDNQEGNG